MLDTQAFVRSAFFEEMRGPVVFVKSLLEFRFHKDIDGTVYACLPSITTIASRLNIEELEIRKQMAALLRLKWARKYKEGKQVAYAIGLPGTLFMVDDIQRSFAKAKRTAKGKVYLTEWRWVPMDEWTGTTVWAYIEERFKKRRVYCTWAKAKGRSQLQNLCAHVGVLAVKDVAEYFTREWKALKVHFKWNGFPSPGMFCGYFGSLKALMENGIPASKAVHDRKFEEVAAEGEWTYL